MTFYLKFHLKTSRRGSSIPIIYGSLPELGGGNPAKGVPLKGIGSVYNFIAEIRIKTSSKSKSASRSSNSTDTVNADCGWYSYCYKPPFGTIVHETVPRRYLPEITSNLEIYDSSETATAICELVVRFRVKCQTKFGEELFIVGDCKELGNWQPEGAQQLFYENETDSWIGDVCFPLQQQTSSRTIQYKYFISGDVSDIRWEPEENHTIHLDTISSPAYIEVSDTFRWTDPIMSVFTRSAFTDVITKRSYPVAPPRISPNSVLPAQVSINFSVMCPHVQRNQQLAIIGSCHELGEWQPENSLYLADADFPLWTGSITLPRVSLPFEYKYIIVNKENYKYALNKKVKSPKNENEIENGDNINNANENLNENKNGDASLLSKDDANGVDEFIWEDSPNRVCRGVTSSTVDVSFPATVIVSDWYVSPNRDLFRGMGIHVPLFSLRTSESCGIGQYSDLRRLVDICRSIGSSMIQIMPINDTTNRNELFDSSPYHAISCFALHPAYVNLLEILPNLPSDVYNDILSRRCEFEQKREVDYPQVCRFKNEALKRIYSYATTEADLDHDREFRTFCAENEEWLKPYALFCHLRDLYGTTDFMNSWPPEHSTVTPDEIDRLSESYHDETQFTYWVQYVCDRQLKASREYATASGVVLKVELPFGVPARSADCWANRRYFDIGIISSNLTSTANASKTSTNPTTKTNEIKKGTSMMVGDIFGPNCNWVPAYNWEAMKADNFAWWRLRMKRCADLFHAAQLDNMLGFFRNWRVPAGKSLGPVLGHFSPCRTLARKELEERGLWDIERYVRPYIRRHILKAKFGDEADRVAEEYFVPRNVDKDDDFFDFQERCNTEVKIEELLNATIWDEGKRGHYRTSLFQLLSDVILIPDDDNNNNDEERFHFRTDVTVEHIERHSVFPSPSWFELDQKQRETICELYNDFTYKRQIDLWIKEAIPKLEMLQESTNLLLFAQDSSNSRNLPEIDHEIESKSIVDLRVPRFPRGNNGSGRDPKKSFDSVSTGMQYMAQLEFALPETSTIRGWWEEDKNTTFTYWKDELKEAAEEAPEFCMSDVITKIIKKNLNSGCMWCTFLLQDVVNMFDRLRRQYPNEERIYNPDRKDIWVYRYPWTLEELAADYEWTNAVHGIVQEARRQ